MSIDDSQSSYFRRLADLAERLAKKKVAIYEHSFEYMAFGSWEIVAGRRERMLRFNYDGKESYLFYCDAAVNPHTHQYALKDRRFATFATHKGEDPLAFVAEVLEKEFST